MAWEVEYTDEFQAWWNGLDDDEQDSIAVMVQILEAKGPALSYPYSSGIQSSRHAHMRELRIQHKGQPYRVLYVFDPRRVAILLIGGSKVGDDRWYEEMVPKADGIYDQHLRDLEIGESSNG